MRTQLVALFTIAFTIVFAAVFYWVFTFTTTRAEDRLRVDLDNTARGAVTGIDGDEIEALYRDGKPRPDGYSDDPRYVRENAYLQQVNRLSPQAMPYTMVRGGRPDTRRVGAAAKAPEYVYIVDVDIPNTPHAGFLETDTLVPEADRAWDTGKLTHRKDIYTDRFGTWLTTYMPIKNHAGTVVALLGCDYEASYVYQVRRSAQRSVARFLLASYVATLVLVWFAAGFFTRPVRELTAATEKLHERDFGSALVLAKRSDELGALARAFNDMSGRLSRAFGELARSNEVLEERVKERTAELASEQEKSERLLRNVLPAEIAERLKREPQTIAEGFDAVTVLFADIVGFTEMSARSSPIEVVRLLNEVFSAFDKLAEKHGLEKIKTIGDAYMVVGGLPVPRADHAAAVADMALEMQAFMHALREKQPGLSIRIGVHTGPVVAGVIGTKKFSYDLWGDTVNVASRMESHGERDRIQLSDAAAAALRVEFDVEERGTIKVKGRGELVTHWLVGRKKK
jgi:class 3 adenylate cyclase